MAGRGRADGGLTGSVRPKSKLCTATAKSTGKQCRRFATIGVRFCRAHGGAGAWVEPLREKALLDRLLDRVKPAAVAEAIGGDDARAVLLGDVALPGDRRTGNDRS